MPAPRVLKDDFCKRKGLLNRHERLPEVLQAVDIYQKGGKLPFAMVEGIGSKVSRLRVLLCCVCRHLP